METAKWEKNEKSNHDSRNLVSSPFSLPPHSSKQKAKKMAAYGQVQGAFMPFFIPALYWLTMMMLQHSESLTN